MQEYVEKLKAIFAGGLLEGWIYEVFAVVLAVLIAAFIVKRLLTKLSERANISQNPWDDALVNSIRKPLRALILIIGISLAAEIVGDQTDAAIFKSIDSIRYVLIIIVIAWALVRFIIEFEKATIEKRLQSGDRIDRTTVHAIGKLIRTAIFITSALVVLQTLGFSISGVLAFGGIGGIAVGFAAKDLLANFFGGLMIFLDRPFSVGDWIRSPDRNIEGTVEQIGWRLTMIRTFDKRPLYVPNSIFANIAVENPSRMSHRRIYETIGLRYSDISQMNKIVDEVKAMLKSHEEIDTTQTMIVNFNAFSESSVDFFVYTFTKTTDWIHYHQVKQDVLLKISNIIEENGAEIAFPSHTMFIESVSGNQTALSSSEQAN